jgi:hypothetical protein
METPTILYTKETREHSYARQVSAVSGSLCSLRE